MKEYLKINCKCNWDDFEKFIKNNDDDKKSICDD